MKTMRSKILLLSILGSLLLSGCSIVNSANSDNNTSDSTIIQNDKIYLVGFTDIYFEEREFVTTSEYGFGYTIDPYLFSGDNDYMYAAIPLAVKNEDGDLHIKQVSYYSGYLTEHVTDNHFGTSFFASDSTDFMFLEVNIYVPSFPDWYSGVLYGIFWNSTKNTLSCNSPNGDGWLPIWDVNNLDNMAKSESYSLKTTTDGYTKNSTIKINYVIQDEYVTSMNVKEYNENDELIKTSDIDISESSTYTPSDECSYLDLEQSLICYTVHDSDTKTQEYTTKHVSRINRKSKSTYKDIIYFTKNSEKIQKKKLRLSFYNY